jgi:hypothetical protein
VLPAAGWSAFLLRQRRLMRKECVLQALASPADKSGEKPLFQLIFSSGSL